MDVSGFALDRLSPIHRSAALRQRSPTTLLSLLCEGPSEACASRGLSKSSIVCLPSALAGARRSAPCGSPASIPRAVVTCSRASSRLARARSRVGRERRRRARYVPTDVYNPRDLFSTTSTFVSADSEPLCPPGLLLGFLPRDASRRGQPTRLGSDRSHADHSLGRSIGPHAILSIAFVPRGRGPWHPSSPIRAADVRCELRARVMREWWSARPEAPRERSFRGLERSRTPFTPHSPPVAGRRIDRSQARSPRTRR